MSDEQKQKPAISFKIPGKTSTGKSEALAALTKELLENLGDIGVKKTSHEKIHETIPYFGHVMDVSGSMNDKKSLGSAWERMYPDDCQLFEAVHAGNVSRIRELVESGQEDINQTTKLRENALHIAARIGGLAVCRELVRLGINIHQEDFFSGHTPLHAAMESGNDHVAVFLALNGAKLDPPSGKLFSPLTGASNGGLLAGMHAGLAGAGKTQPPPQPDPKFSPEAFDRIRAKLSRQQIRKAKGLAHLRRKRGPGGNGGKP